MYCIISLTLDNIHTFFFVHVNLMYQYRPVAVHVYKFVIFQSSTAADSLIVSIPKRTPTTELTIPSSPGKLVIDSSSASVKPSGLALQNMARKISRKNHKIAQQRQQGLFSQRRCPSCGHLTPSLKKRCLQCQSFLVGRACPSCNELNHNRSIFCSKCHTSLYPDKSGVNVKLGTIQVSYSFDTVYVATGGTYYINTICYLFWCCLAMMNFFFPLSSLLHRWRHHHLKPQTCTIHQVSQVVVD